MTIVFHARPYDRFIEKQSNLMKKKLNRTGLASVFSEAFLAIEIKKSPNSL